MGALYIAVILPTILLVGVEYSSAWPGDRATPVSKKNSPTPASTETRDFVIENKILKGAIKPISDNRKIGQIVFDTLSSSPDHVSQIDVKSGKQTTFGEMKDRTVRCSLWMQKQGIKPDDIVVVVTHNHLNSYIPFLATFFVDAIVNAWSENIALSTARRFMKLFTPKFIFTNEKAAVVITEAAKLENVNAKIVVLGKYSNLPTLKEIMDAQTNQEVKNFAVANKKSPGELAAIMLSSGSTGLPKGVMWSGKSLASQFGQKVPIISESSRLLWYSGLDWMTGFGMPLRTIVQKGTYIIPSSTDTQNFLQTVQDYKVNIVFLPPVFLNYLVKDGTSKKFNLQSLKLMTSGGGKISREILEDLKKQFPNVFFLQGYGATEIGLTLAHTTPKTKNIESVGSIFANYQAKFVDVTTGKVLGPNQHGELYVKSPAVMLGYYKNLEATREVIDAEGWYHTGDIGYYDENGEIFIVDRIKEIMKYRGFQVSPSEIEEILLLHPQIEEAAVVGVPHEIDGDWPVAFVKKQPGSKVTKCELTKLTLMLEDYKQLQGRIHFLDNMPHTSSGKIARNELKQMAKKITQTTSKAS